MIRIRRVALILATGVVAIPATLSAGASPNASVVIVAAGDIACAKHGPFLDTCRHGPVSDRILITNPAAVLTLGDNQYASGSLIQYQTYYQPTWGRFLDRTYPAPGNHEYFTTGAQGYFDYYGARPPGPYYSFDLGDWHLISLNSEIDMAEGSPQNDWLEADLAATSRTCVMAYMHKPRFTSGINHPPNIAVRPLWDDLYAARADVVLAAHNHQYERFAEMTPGGRVDWLTGLRSFVVGTGGTGHYGFGTPKTGSQFRDNTNYGVLKLTLKPAKYTWAFISEGGTTYDSGSSPCQ
ncbi:hypothetical protein BH20ACT24_BH20ACT24_16610 [soil metagenome]